MPFGQHQDTELWNLELALEQARDLRTSGDFRSLSRFITQILRHSSLSVLSPIILPLQKFFSRILLLRQQAFSSGNLPPERPTTTTTAIKTQVFMFRYERVNSTRKFTIGVEIVSLLKKIYERDAPFGAVFKVKTLAVLFLPYPREMKTNTAKFNLPPFCRLLFCIASINVKPEGGGGPRADVGYLTSIAFPILGNLTKNLGPRVGKFAFFSRRNWDQVKSFWSS